MRLTRRGLLASASAGLFAGALGKPARALAANGLTDRLVPGAAGSFNVLEIFFSGALSHRETFWVEQPDELPVERGLSSLNPLTHATTKPPGAPADWTAWLAAQNAYLNSDYKVGSTTDGDIHLGPGFKPIVDPLSSGLRLRDRLRVVALTHDAPVHPVAQGYATQGIYDGSSATKVSGAGAAFMRHTGRQSYVFFHNGMIDSRETARVATVSGRHGAYNAPIAIPFDDPGLVSALGTARDPARDDLNAFYSDQYEGGLTFQHATASGVRARSSALDRYLDSIGAAYDGPALAAALGELSVSSGSSLWDNGTRRAIKASVALLAAGQSAYCMVCDPGVTGAPTPFAYYDQHGISNATEHSASVTANVLNVMRTLREEVEAGRLDLDNTLVVFNTEFGRAFSASDTGSDHCPAGFAVALLGGPIAQGDGGVVGRLPFTSADDGAAREAGAPATAARTGGGQGHNPTDLRAAIYQAGGVHPFQSDVFDVGESTASGTPGDAADDLATTLFG